MYVFFCFRFQSFLKYVFISLLTSLSGKNLDLFFYKRAICIFLLLNFSINLNFNLNKN